MTYGDSREDEESKEGEKGGNHVLGDLMGLASSVACGFYEVRSIHP